MSRVRLTGRGRRRLEGGHPWVFADDVAETHAEAGDVVALEDPHGAHLGFGLYSAESKIRVRLCTRRAERPDERFWIEQLERAADALTLMANRQVKGKVVLTT